MRVWIGLTGYARTGKDTVASLLQELEPRFELVSMGNLINNGIVSWLIVFRHADTDIIFL